MNHERSDATEAPTYAARTRILIVALVVAVGAAAAFAALWLRDRDPSPSEVSSYLGEERSEISDSARRALEGLMNYDAQTLERRRAELEPLLSDDLRDQYDEIITGGLDRAVQQMGATAEAEIVSGPDVAFTSGERAEAVARVVQEVMIENDPTTWFYVLRLALVPEEGAWKVDGIEFLSRHRSN